MSQILLIIFMDTVSTCSQETEGSPLWWREDHLCFLALPEGDFPLSLLWFPVEYEVIAIKISLSKSLSQKKVECPLWSGDELLPQVEEFRYLVVMSERS